MLLPTDDWAELETLRSPTGWVEVQKDCLVRPTPIALHFYRF
jgi:hypothetical protein